jgi:hypothetical protein
VSSRLYKTKLVNVIHLCDISIYFVSKLNTLVYALQATATQQSQTPLPVPLPECQFIASCRDNLPPSRPTTANLGLKRKKNVRRKKKENIVPKA